MQYFKNKYSWWNKKGAQNRSFLFLCFIFLFNLMYLLGPRSWRDSASFLFHKHSFSCKTSSLFSLLLLVVCCHVILFSFFFCFTGSIDKLQTHPNPQLASSSSSSNQSFHLTDIILSYYPGSSNLEKKWCAFSSKSFFIQCCSTEPDLDKPVKDHITPYSNTFIINLYSPYLWLKGFNSGTH